MNALLLFFICTIGYIIAYATYGRYLSRRIFNINPTHPTPSKTLEDGVDYVPTKRGVLFGHHFASIAGTGPIVGPAIGVIWGWLPAILWVFFGSIFMGAVHDFSALIISMRHDGKSISEIASIYISPRVRTLFFMIVFLALLIVIAIFGLVIAVIFSRFPQAVFPVWAEIPIAIALGTIVYKKGGNLRLFTTLAVLVMYLTVILGHYIPIQLGSFFGIPATGLWTIILLGYAFIAATLPVTTLLQPRDYINAWQLYIALGAIILGMLVTGLTSDLSMHAPAINLAPKGAPPMWPFLFITIACGAISGFHSLVSSGTSSKQIASEKDAQLIGFGSMLVEALLATIVIIAVTAGLGMAYTTSDGTLLHGLAAWQQHYSSWQSSAGLGSKLTAVVVGCANMMESIFIPRDLGIVIIGVFIASFAGTTLDSATRIQRYVVHELFAPTSFSIFNNKWFTTGFVVVSAALLAFSSGANGKGALALWPLFGAVNQLLAALALLVATAYLKQKLPWGYLVTGIPCVIMLVLSMWACSANQLSFIASGQWVLIIINTLIILLSVIMIVETFLLFAKRPILKRAEAQI